ncbi:MAG: 50S ribosomal protein L18 [Patescibacteria group bacterium]
MKTKREKRINRHRKVRMKVKGTKDRPRFCVFKSNSHIYAQLINDETGKTIASSSDLVIEAEKPSTNSFAKVANAQAVGFDLAKKALDKKISQVVFDRGGFLFTGRVKAVADGAREGGLKF